MKKKVSHNLSKLKNAQNLQKTEVVLTFSKILLGIITVLREEGYIRGFSNDSNNIKVFLKYLNKKPTFQNLTIISKPSHRVYYTYSEILKKNIKGGLFILSTSDGVYSSNKALKYSFGGEILCYIR